MDNLNENQLNEQGEQQVQDTPAQEAPVEQTPNFQDAPYTPDVAIEPVTSNPKSKVIGIVAVLVAIALVIGLLSVLFSGGNSYKTPVKLIEKARNTKKYSQYVAYSIEYLNGFGEKQVKQMYDIFEKSEDYEEDLEDHTDSFSEDIENLEDEYGKNYKFAYKITDKEKLDKDDLEDFEDVLKEKGKSWLEEFEEMEDYDSDEWEDFAEDLGISKSDAKKFVKLYEEYAKLLKKAKVTDGYELEVTQIVTGSELDEPEEKEITIFVYKVNGRWVTSNILYPTSFFY